MKLQRVLSLKMSGEDVKFLQTKLNNLKNYSFPSLISSTISGFSNVDVSPKLEKSPSAIFLNILRMILPLRVFGNPLTNCILSAFAMAPTQDPGH